MTSVLSAEISGNGPPLLAVHASGMSSRQWVRLARDAHAQFTVHAVDLLGVGKTPLSDPSAYSLDLEVSALVSTLATLPAPAVLVGHSYGAMVALEAALRSPRLVRAMVLYEPVIVHLARETGSAQARSEIAAIHTLMQVPITESYEPWLQGFIDWWNGPGAYASLPAPTRAQYLSTAHEAHRQAGAVSQCTVTLERLRTLEIPTLFLTGNLSPACARESAQKASDAMPDAQLLALEGMGHMGPLTHATQVHRALFHFVHSQA
ncbi:MAG: alpha/beta hydrolase [Deltaproteobacteria bacterium]|nr:alpha/beta hydrolase [Deltaproteobacteria bacterium]